MAEIALLATIEMVAKQYGNREQIDPKILLDCVTLMIDRFGYLGINEIGEAYNLWALREIKGMEMYHAEFNAANFRRVMSDYVEYRKLAVAAIVNRREAAEYEQRRDEMASNKAIQVRELFAKDIQAAPQRHQAGLKPQSWRDIPAHWYGIAEDTRVINFAGIDKKAYFEKALPVTLAEIASEVAGLKSGKRSLEARNHAKLNAQGEETFKRRQVVNAQKMMIFDCFVLGILGARK